MIVHVLEVWAALAVSFVAGCVGGTYMFRLIARGRFAAVQQGLTGAIAGVADGVRGRFGVAPPPRVSVQRPVPVRRVAPPPVEPPASEAIWEVVDRAMAERTAALRQYDATTRLAESDGVAAPSVSPEPSIADRAAAADVAEEDIAESERMNDAMPGDLAEETEGVQPVAARVNGVPAAPRTPLLRPPLPPTPPARPPSIRPRLVVARDPAPLPPVDDEIRRPALLKEPRNGVPDNLTRIRGIGERNEVRLNALGIYHFSQIAAWTPPEIRWIGQQLSFPERIEQDDWVGQAIILASGRPTGFTKSAERRRDRRRGREAAEPPPDAPPDET